MSIPLHILLFFSLFYYILIWIIFLIYVIINIHRNKTEKNGLILETPDKNERSIRRQNFLSSGPRIFNTLPMELRSLQDSMDVFKKKLDQFVSIIPDKPRIGGDTKNNSNSLDGAIKEWNYTIVFWTTY